MDFALWREMIRTGCDQAMQGIVQLVAIDRWLLRQFRAP
jgi:hypothetical protein